MTPLADVLIVAIPLAAFVTIALALRRGRPRPFESWGSARIQARIDELDRVPGGPAGPDAARERRRLREELLRRGLGR